jgi:uncharacterized protein (DUF983 family)
MMSKASCHSVPAVQALQCLSLDWSMPVVASGAMKNTPAPPTESTPLLPPDDLLAARQIGAAMLKGAKGRCPACGTGKLYNGFLKVADRCASCGTELHHHRADDAPPYFTMFIVGHIVVGGLLIVEKKFAPDTLTQLLIWLPLTCVLSLVLLPIIKGALIGQQWALRLHGFGPETPDPSGPDPIPVPAGRRSSGNDTL